MVELSTLEIVAPYSMFDGVRSAPANVPLLRVTFGLVVLSVPVAVPFAEDRKAN